MAFKRTLLYQKQSPYQNIAFFTETNGTFSLTLDNYWQFNSGVEHIYHETLFMMPALFPKNLKTVLVLGGGDGLGARDLLNFKTIERIDVVDLDPDIVQFAKENVLMTNLNRGSFNDPRVNLIVTDAKKWLAESPPQKYDLIVIDFPDPTSDLLWGLYTVELYQQVAKRLQPDGVVAIQSSTYNTKDYELIFEHLDEVFPLILGYHTGASSVFCGFFICSFLPINRARNIPQNARWLTPSLINSILALPIYQLNAAKIDTPANIIKKLYVDMQNQRR